MTDARPTTSHRPRTGRETPLTTPPKPERRSLADRLPPLDWAAGHGPATGTLSVTTGAAALALAGATVHLDPAVPLLAAAGGAAIHGLGTSLRRGLTAPSVLTRTAAWLGCGTWDYYALAHGPLTRAALTALGGLGLAIYAGAHHAELTELAHEDPAPATPPDPDPAQLEAARQRARDAIAEIWEARIKAVTGLDVRIESVESWSDDAGLSLEVALPNRATVKTLSGAAEALAAAADLPLGCVIKVVPGPSQGFAILDIPTRNRMSEIVDLPADYSPISLLTGIPWGMLPIGELATVLLREANALIVGPPGSGKSTFLDVVITGFDRCIDTLTWVIDLGKHGGAGIGWVLPFLEARGLVPTPPGAQPAPADTQPGVDWIAGTPAEALIMVSVALAIGKARELEYQALMRQQNTNLLPISARIPQIEIVIDEGVELLAPVRFTDKLMRALQEGVQRVSRTTRAMGIRLVTTAVDANLSAIGDTSILKFAPVGVALTSMESTGNVAGKLFPKARIDTSQLTAQGSGVIGQAGEGGFPPTPFKGWRTSPNQTREAVIETRALRPTLDPVSLRAAGSAYAERWSQERAGWLWATSPNTAVDPGEPGQAPRPTGTPALLPFTLGATRPAADTSGAASADDDAAEPDQDEAAIERFRQQIDATFETTDEPGSGPVEPPAAHRGLLPLNLTATSGRDQAPAGETAPAADWLPRALAAIRAAGPDGMKPAAIADLVGRHRSTVRSALQAAVDRGELVYLDRGPHSAYVHPDHTR